MSPFHTLLQHPWDTLERLIGHLDSWAWTSSAPATLRPRSPPPRGRTALKCEKIKTHREFPLFFFIANLCVQSVVWRWRSAPGWRAARRTPLSLEPPSPYRGCTGGRWGPRPRQSGTSLHVRTWVGCLETSSVSSLNNAIFTPFLRYFQENGASFVATKSCSFKSLMPSWHEKLQN